MTGQDHRSQSRPSASAVSRSPEREFVFRSQNPYAHLSMFGEPEEDLDSKAHRYVALLQNPYASLSIFDQEGDEMTAVPCQVELPLVSPERPVRTVISTSSMNIKPRVGISKSAFAKGCREVFRQYEPLNTDATRVRRQFLDFIEQNQSKSPQSRAAILEELSRYNLGGRLHPHLNRERQTEVMSKLRSISDSHPS